MKRRPQVARLVTLVAVVLLVLACTSCGDDGSGKPGSAVNPLAAGGGAGASSLWELAPLTADLLDRIQEDIGRRAGVRIVRVRAGGAAALGGVQDGDVLLAVDGAVVASPAEVATALEGQTGTVGLTVLRVGPDDAWSLPQLTISIVAAPPATAPPETPAAPATPATPATQPPAAPPTVPAGAPDRPLRVVVEAFFDMLDFSRTEGWGRRSVTSEATRRRSEALLRRHLPEIDAQTIAVIRKIPAAWEALRTRWAAASESERRRQRAFWKHKLLLPNPLLPPAGALKTFRSEAGGHAFQHPADWVVAQTSDGDTGYLYLGPAGTQAMWAQVADPAQSPPGVLFAIAPTDAGLRAVNSPIEGARYVARKFVLARAPEMKEVAAFGLGPGALVAYVGRYPGSAQESFCWVAAMPFGNGKVIAGRFAGPVAKAEALLPAFSVILATSEVTPPDDLASLQVNLAASIIGNAVINTGWSH